MSRFVQVPLYDESEDRLEYFSVDADRIVSVHLETVEDSRHDGLVWNVEAFLDFVHPLASGSWSFQFPTLAEAESIIRHLEGRGP